MIIGGKTDANAHPHVDHKGRVAIVHNGTIENSDTLKKELMAKGIAFKSQTDTEVIAQMIGSYLDDGLAILDAVNQTLARLEGTWGLAVIHRDTPGQVIAARNGSPLVVGVGRGRHFVASEPTAFSRHTTQFISLKDGEVAVVTAAGVSLDLARMEHAHKEHIELSPAPYPHWTIKEIMEQPEAIERTLANGSRLSTTESKVKLGGLQANLEKLLPIRSLVVAACGTSQFAGLYGMKLMQSLKSFDNVSVIDASEITPDSLPSKAGGLLAISQSGETKDTHRSVITAEQLGLPIFSVVNQVGSLIARTTNCGMFPTFMNVNDS
jgi:glucosamine--fructose-6-phosphate aminotransferase (isomerizing)